MVRVARPDDVPAALRQLEVASPRAVLVVVGSAQRLTGASLHAAEQLFEAVVVPLCEELGVDVVDGGTDAGVMQAMGQARAAVGAEFALVGVVAGGTVGSGGGDADVDDDPVRFEPNHTHFVIVPGSDWGDESPWITRVASALAGSLPGRRAAWSAAATSPSATSAISWTPGTRCSRWAEAAISPTRSPRDGPADDADVEKLRVSALVQPIAGFAHPDRLAAVLRAALGSD